MDEHDRPAAPAPVTFDDLAAAYLEDYQLQRYRTLNSAKGRVANLKTVFGGQPASAITLAQFASTSRSAASSAGRPPR